MRTVAACVQLTSTKDLARNLDRAAALCERARARGAELIALPENFALVGDGEEDKLAHLEDLDGKGPILSRMAEVARATGAWLILGGMPERSPEPRHSYNSCVLLAPDGEVRAVYRKMHLFDVDVNDGAVYRESRTVTPGAEPVLAETPFGPLGLSVCYDLRFPELYRSLSARGAKLLVVPAAFTLMTGKDHWHVLLRARAIENQCFVLAPAQQGRHNGKRQTYGHSLIVDPWGTVLADASDGEGLAVAELDFDLLDRVRMEVPCLQHRRM